MSGDFSQKEADYCECCCRCENRRRDVRDRSDNTFFFIVDLAVFFVSLGEKNCVVNGCTELNGADNQIGDVEKRVARDEREREIYPDGGFNCENEYS